MDQDDPEKRIAELERQLAEARAAGDPGAGQGYESRSTLSTGGWLTPEDVRNTAFSKPPIGKRGYNEVEVDAFLDRVKAAEISVGPAYHSVTPGPIEGPLQHHAAALLSLISESYLTGQAAAGAKNTLLTTG
jgi:DivIVA domain-containing protein